eukprot:SAG22_NODE_219_length_14877_cov_14.334619_16_plen_255_part_00
MAQCWRRSYQRRRARGTDSRRSCMGAAAAMADEALRRLGLQGKPNCSDDELKRAYQSKALEHHPDRWQTHGPRAQLQAKRNFQAVNESYTLLTELRARPAGSGWFGAAPSAASAGRSNAGAGGAPPRQDHSGYDGADGFSSSRSYRPPWAAQPHPHASTMHDGYKSWEKTDYYQQQAAARRQPPIRLSWLLMLPVAFIFAKNVFLLLSIAPGRPLQQPESASAAAAVQSDCDRRAPPRTAAANQDVNARSTNRS